MRTNDDSVAAPRLRRRPMVARVLRVGALVGSVLLLASLFAPAEAQSGPKIASGRVDKARAGEAWRSHAYRPQQTGQKQLELTWSGSGMLRFEIRDNGGEWLAGNSTNARPKSMTFRVVAGRTYRVNVWAVSGAGDYEVRFPSTDGGGEAGSGSTLIDSGYLDHARANNPRWTTTTYRATRTGRTKFDLTWSESAKLRFEVRSANGTWLGADTSDRRPKSVTIPTTAGASYKINIWATANKGKYWLNADAPSGDGGGTGDGGGGGQSRPNILFIMTDDQRIDTMSVMPKTRGWLGDNGTTYTQGYVTTPSCCPSRATVLTGRYVHNNGVTSQTGPAADNRTFINKYLQDAGYFTGHAGKYLHYVPIGTVEPNWDRWTYFKTGYYNPEVNRDGVVRVENGSYTSNVAFNAAVDYVEDFERRNDDKPWFLHITPTAPHRQGWDPPVPETRYANAPIPAWNKEPSVTETNRSDKPPFINCCNITPENIKPTRDAQLRALMTVDDGVDRLMKALRDNGELANTLIIFTSDNGWLLSDHGAHEKFLPYKHSVRVPFIVRWDGKVARGATSDKFVSNVDVGPTVMKAAGINNLRAPMDGIDIVNGPRRWRRLTEYWQDNGSVRQIPDWASLTTANFQYNEYYEADSTTVRFREYYDLRNDPYQLTNLYLDGNPANDPDAGWMHDRLAADRACVGTACP